MFKEMVSKFAQEEIKPKVFEMDENQKIDEGILKSLFDNGFMGIEIPEKYGGSESSFTSAIVGIEELAKVDPSVSVCMDVQNTLVNNMFSFYASDRLKEKYLTQLSTSKVGCFCLSEANSGSDAFALQTKAEKEGSKFRINGSKSWITNSGEAEVFLVMANVDSSLGYKGITCFVLDRESIESGSIEVGKRENKLGIKASSTCTVTLEDVVVGEESVLGEVGKGYKYAIEILNEGRIGIGAQMVGLAQGALDSTLPYLGERTQFGQKIGSFQGMEQQYAQAATEVEAARLMVYNAARMKQEGKNFVKEAAMAKLFSSQVAGNVSRKCVEWMGGVGFTKEYPQEKFFRDSVIGSIYEGTSNIQLQTIAKILQKDYW